MSEKIYGINSVKEALAKNQSIDKIFLNRESTHSAIKEIRNLANTAKIPVSSVPKVKLDRLIAQNHQGVVAKIAAVDLIPLEDMVDSAFQTEENPSFLLLDQISDVGNFGAILRTAACVGINGVIISKTGSAPINEDVAKRSSGALFHTKLCKVDHLKDALFYLKAYDVHCVAATEKATTSIYEADFKKPTAILMGNEHQGISPSLLKTSDQTVHIPMTGEMDSLNVSVASSVVMYELFRQRLS